uniref:tetratricopeptide repeat protein n=1 Tax=Alistipes sp. TaxID=1872444 RepID=UPI004056F283
MQRLIYTLLLLLLSLPAVAQRYPERREVRKGNRAYEKGRYEVATDRYRRALEVAPECWEGSYNLGSALYRTEQYDHAAELLSKVAQDTLRTALERSEAYYNLGNVHFARQKLQESLDAFRSALRLNPEDEDAKFNFTYVKRLMQEQENQEEQQNEGENPESEENPEEAEGQNQPSDPRDESEGEGEPQPREGRLSEEEQERLLEAIQAQEDQTQERLNERRGVVVRGSKPW